MRWIESSAASVSRCETTPGWWETHTSAEGGGRWKTGRQRWAPTQSCPRGRIASSRTAPPGIPGPHRAHPQVLSWALQVQPKPRAAQGRSTRYRRSQNHRINRYMLLEHQVPSAIRWVDKSSLLKFCYICLKRKPCISQSKTYLINKH